MIDTLIGLLPFLFLLGLVAGFLAGLLGVGGGIVLVPGLYFLLTAFGYPPEYMMHMAVGTSLAIIIPTGMSSARAHWKRDAVGTDLLRKIGPGTVAGVVVGTVIAAYIDGNALKGIFAVMLLVLAAIMVVNPAKILPHGTMPKQPWPGMAGGVIGMLSSLMGIGGATISVPFMTLCGVPVHRAVGTAAALGLVISIPAAMGFIVIGWGAENLPPFSLGYVSLLAFALIVPCSVLAAPWGARVAHSVSVTKLRLAFAFFIALVSFRMLYSLFVG